MESILNIEHSAHGKRVPEKEPPMHIHHLESLLNKCSLQQISNILKFNWLSVFRLDIEWAENLATISTKYPEQSKSLHLFVDFGVGLSPS